MTPGAIPSATLGWRPVKRPAVLPATTGLAPGFAVVSERGYSTSVPPKISSKDAAAEYERRFGRSWRVDGTAGFHAATCVEFGRRLMHRLEACRRIPVAEERRLDPLPPIPDWLEVGMAELAAVVRADAHPARFGLFPRLIAEPNALELIAQDKPFPATMTVLTLLMPDLIKAAAQRIQTGAARDSTQAFYSVTRAVWLYHHGAKPAPSTMALLAGAAGMEQYDRIGPASKTWESRVRRWRDNPGLDEDYAQLMTALHSPEPKK